VSRIKILEKYEILLEKRMFYKEMAVSDKTIRIVERTSPMGNAGC